MNTQSTASIAIVDFGMGNLHSVARALAHVSPKTRIEITADPAVIHRAARVVFPGQGAMPDAMRSLAARPGLAEAVREEEEHLDYFDTQLAVLERVGEQNYLARYAMPEST